MSRARTLLVLAAFLGGPLLGCGGLMASIFTSFPPHQGARVQGTGFIGVETGGAYAWVIDTQTGVVLIDAGMDPNAEALHQVIGSRPVRAVLLTHGHLDHVAGLKSLGSEATFCGLGEAGVARGEVSPKSWAASIFGPLMSYPEPAPAITEIRDGQVLLLDGARFEGVHLPGHTAGSMAWVHGDTVFTGDAALGHGDHLEPVHWAFSDDDAQAIASLTRLSTLEVIHLADGHAGLHPMPR